MKKSERVKMKKIEKVPAKIVEKLKEKVQKVESWKWNVKLDMIGLCMWL